MPRAGRIAAVWAFHAASPTDEPPYAQAMLVLPPWLLGEAQRGALWGADAWRERRPGARVAHTTNLGKGTSRVRWVTSGMRALVTGGLGFIGSHVADALVSDGWAVDALDNLDPRAHRGEPPTPPGASFVRGDVRSTPDLAGVDVVFHQAGLVGLGRGAPDASEYVDVNVRGTIELLHACARGGVKRLVLASSMAIYGEGGYACAICGPSRPAPRAPPAWEPRCRECGGALAPFAVPEEHPCEPATVYANSKLAQERLAMSVGRELGVPVVALRYHNVYGARMPRDSPYSGVAAMFRSRILAGVPPLVHEDGRQMRDFVRVEDVARANLLAALAPEDRVAFEAFNVASGDPRPVMDLARELCRAMRPDLDPQLSCTWRPGDPRHVFASVDKARKALGFDPKIGFHEGVRKFAGEETRG